MLSGVDMCTRACVCVMRGESWFGSCGNIVYDEKLQCLNMHVCLLICLRLSMFAYMCKRGRKGGKKTGREWKVCCAQQER